jgi:fructose-1,6-bisphosphatase/inositol monophosphatase family enzyme
MRSDIKILANKTVDKIYKKICRSYDKDFYRFGTNIGIGADGTPTKYIDKIAEDVALKFLEKSDLKANVLSEEAGFVDFGSDYTFVLDPLDGTRNAYRGIPFFSVSLAVGKKSIDDVEYGIVKNIPTGDVFIAERNCGAFFNKNQIFTPEVPSNEMLSCISLGKNSNNLTITLAKKDNFRSFGSASLEMCMVANGGLDYYLVAKEYLRITDIAAAFLVLKEAGGMITDINGGNLKMALNLDERTSIIAACSEELINKILAYGKN